MAAPPIKRIVPSADCPACCAMYCYVAHGFFTNTPEAIAEQMVVYGCCAAHKYLYTLQTREERDIERIDRDWDPPN